MKKSVSAAFAVTLCLLSLTSLAQAAESNGVKAPKNGTPGQTVEIKVRPQAWQVRRGEFAKTVNAINASQGKDQAALKKLDMILTDMEKTPMSRTPMEAMDIYGVFYVPREGEKNMKSLLSMISAYAILGWYDALRFGDESGRAEIVNNERFFLRAFALSGEDGVKQLTILIQEHPKEAAEAVQKGVLIATTYRGKVQYDESWPSAYGLQRTLCGLEGAKECPKPQALPKDKWNAAFEEAVARVKHYYRDNSKKN